MYWLNIFNNTTIHTNTFPLSWLSLCENISTTTNRKGWSSESTVSYVNVIIFQKRGGQVTQVFFCLCVYIWWLKVYCMWDCFKTMTPVFAMKETSAGATLRLRDKNKLKLWLIFVSRIKSLSIEFADHENTVKHLQPYPQTARPLFKSWNHGKLYCIRTGILKLVGLGCLGLFFLYCLL